MQLAPVNFAPVLVSAVVAFLLGWFWYSQAGFGKTWMRIINLSKKDMEEQKNKGMATPMIVGLITYIVLAFILAQVIYATGSLSAGTGAIAGFWTWLGFVATLSLGAVLWENKPMSLWYINNGYHLVAFLAMGAIIGAWL